MEAEVISKVFSERPHLVILGAGASLAALPNGDRWGNRLPLMTDFIKTIGAEESFSDVVSRSKSNNFEEIYSQIHSEGSSDILVEMEDYIYQYFSKLTLPFQPTIYDYLVLSLREKDAIATFNWDPFLIQSYIRVRKITTKLPQLLFLHGTVALGICEKCKKIGLSEGDCICGRRYEKIKLLYPVREKNYSSHWFIKEQWRMVRLYLKDSSSITIFGYGAPKSDKSAINLFKKAWGKIEDRRFEQIEIIDVREEEDLRKTWNRFIHTHHYSVCADYFESIIAKFPRRINEAYFGTFRLNISLTGHKIPFGLSFRELAIRFNELIQHEP